MCRYTPACEEFIPESQRLEGYITNKLLNISRCMYSRHIHQLAIVYMLYAMLNFDEVYIQRC